MIKNQLVGEEKMLKKTLSLLLGVSLIFNLILVIIVIFLSIRLISP